MRTTSATGSSRPQRRAAGFTLIELSLVVFVLALMIALAAPQFVRSYNSSLLSETARRFATTCQFARMQAVLHQQPVILHVDARQQRFWLTQPLSTEGGPAQEQTLRAVAIAGRVSLVGVEVARTEAEGASDPQAAQVTFYPNGTCDAATVVFRGQERGSDLAVALDAITGKPVVYPVSAATS